MFTGDRSGDWLYEALHRFGFASQAESHNRDDGLFLIDACITAVARCAPPGNKPNAGELENCRAYLVRELGLMDRVRVVIALGRVGFEGFLAAWRAADRTVPRPKPKFSHGSQSFLEGPNGKVFLLGSYHPSQQNTFTGRLTRSMFHQVFRRARRYLDRADA
jgi:uracil-DNA glycosylase family 4